jgi:hypothetical protein
MWRVCGYDSFHLVGVQEQRELAGRWYHFNAWPRIPKDDEPFNPFLWYTTKHNNERVSGGTDNIVA